MKRASKFLLYVCLTFTIFSAFVLPISFFQNFETHAVSTSARAMCVLESQTGRVLYSKNKDHKLAMASTTKIMTAITAIENAKSLDEEFEISPKAVGIEGTSIYLRKGEVMTLKDLLYGLMLVSGNDASVAIGEYVGGNVKNFVSMMNELADKIGATNTHFDNTHGLDSDTHYTTAYDLALITSYALKNPVFKEIVSTPNTKITNEAGKTRYLKNKNKLLSSLEGCSGVKTGFTNDAGRCLVSSCERDGMTLVCVVLNCGPMFEESRELLEQGFSEYKLYDLTDFYTFPKTIAVVGGRQKYVEVYTKGEYYYPLTEKEFASVRYEYNFSQNLEAPVSKEDEVGEVEIFIDNDLHFSEKIYTMENVRRKTIWSKLQDWVDSLKK